MLFEPNCVYGWLQMNNSVEFSLFFSAFVMSEVKTYGFIEERINISKF